MVAKLPYPDPAEPMEVGRPWVDALVGRLVQEIEAVAEEKRRAMGSPLTTIQTILACEGVIASLFLQLPPDIRVGVFNELVTRMRLECGIDTVDPVK